MKKFIHNIYLLTALFLTVTACTKEDAVLDSSAVEKEQPVNKTYTMTVNASKGEDVATTRALSLDGTTLNSSWKTGETVKVYKSSTELGTLTAQSDGPNTTLSGTLTGTIAVDDVLTLKFLSSNYTTQEGTLAYIATHCDYAEATVTVSSVSGGNITPTSAATFVNRQAIVKFTLKDKADNGTTSLSVSQLVVNAGSNSYTITPASATNVIYVAIPGISGENISLTATVGSDTYTYSKTGVSFTNSQYYTIGVKMTRQAKIADIGRIIATNGCIYEDLSSVHSSTTAAGMIAYVGNASNCTHGLAIALNGETNKTFDGAQAAATALNTSLAVVNGTWRVPTKEDWQYMFIGCAASGDTTTKATSMQVNGFISTITEIPEGNTLWTSSPSGSSGYNVYFSEYSGNNWAEFQVATEGQSLAYRAVLAF